MWRSKRKGAAPRSHGLIRSPQDFWGGVVLIGVAVFAVWASSDLPGMRGFAFGPGTAPRMFAYCLMGGSLLASCKEGAVVGSVAGNGFGALVTVSEAAKAAIAKLR